MKNLKIIYWATTVFLALMMAFAAYAYLTQPEIKQGFQHLGFPDYFRIELAIAKLIGAVVLLVPVSGRVKEWAYAGFGITFLSAFIAHSALGDSISSSLAPLIMMLLLIFSYITYHRSHTTDKLSSLQKSVLAS